MLACFCYAHSQCSPLCIARGTEEYDYDEPNLTTLLTSTVIAEFLCGYEVLGGISLNHENGESLSIKTRDQHEVENGRLCDIKLLINLLM